MLDGFGTRCENLSKDVDEHVVQPEENASEASVDKSNETILKNVPFPFDPGIKPDADNYYNEAENENEQENSNPNDEKDMRETSISNDENEETAKDDSESQDVSEESLDFQSDAPSVVVCCYYRNTSPSIVQYLTTRRAKTADLNE